MLSRVQLPQPGQVPAAASGCPTAACIGEPVLSTVFESRSGFTRSPCLPAGGCYQIGCDNTGTDNVGTGNSGTSNRGNDLQGELYAIGTSQGASLVSWGRLPAVAFMSLVLIDCPSLVLAEVVLRFLLQAPCWLVA